MCAAVSTGKVWDGWANDGEGAWKDGEADAGPKKKPRVRPPNNRILPSEDDDDGDEVVESKAHGVPEIILLAEHEHTHTHANLPLRC